LSLTARSDAELVELALRPATREAALGRLLDRFERPIYSLILRMVRDEALAEDLTQESFIRAFLALDAYDPARKFSNWIFRIAHNLTIDHLRKRRIETVSLDGSTHARTSEEEARTRILIEDPGETPDRLLENRALANRIERAIGELRPDYRTAILLRHAEGHSYEEVAEIMELPLGTVKTFIHRGRLELRILLAEADR